MPKLTIDRFEGKYAVCETEDRNQQMLERAMLPPEVKEGDCLEISANGGIKIDKEATFEKREAANILLKSLLKR